jgi:carbon-monoxide dehydrogenase large subunit
VSDLGVASAGRFVGQSVVRKEDPRLLTGHGRFTDDVVVRGALHAHFVRSDHARARLTRVDVTAARAAEGVVAVFTAEDLNDRVVVSMLPSMLLDGEATGTPLVPLARGDVRFVGDPVVLIVARDRYLAEDAAELVELDYDPLPPVVDLTAAAADDAPRVHEERPSNLQTAIVVPMSDDARTAFDAAPHHVEATLVQHRHSANPLECRAVVSTFDRVAGTLDVHVSSQNPHEARQVFARVTGVPEHLVRVRIGDVGGGFGLKHAMGREEQVVVLASYVLGRRPPRAPGGVVARPP